MGDSNKSGNSNKDDNKKSNKNVNTRNTNNKADKEDVFYTKTVAWAKNENDNSNSSGGYGIYFFISITILIIFIIWLVIRYTSKSSESTLEDLNDAKNVIPAYDDDDYEDYSD
jgi:hypothetical protein